jgi:hypothetical protein
LADGPALHRAVEVAHIDHIPQLGNGVVGRDHDVPGGDPPARVIDQFKHHTTTTGVGPTDDEGRALDELEFDPVASGMPGGCSLTGVVEFEAIALFNPLSLQNHLMGS